MGPIDSIPVCPLLSPWLTLFYTIFFSSLFLLLTFNSRSYSYFQVYLSFSTWPLLWSYSHVFKYLLSLWSPHATLPLLFSVPIRYGFHYTNLRVCQRTLSLYFGSTWIGVIYIRSVMAVAAHLFT